MSKGRFWAITGAGLWLVLFGCLERWAPDVKTPRITREELKAVLGNQDVIIIDVRLKDEWEKSRWKIQGAVREDPEKDFKSWADKYSRDKMMVFY